MMSLRFLKACDPHAEAAPADLSLSVAARLAELEAGGEPVARRMARELDGWEADPRISPGRSRRP
ncbi:hypothetical protein FGG78_30345, partial [Thioclava sp. BHET1]